MNKINKMVKKGFSMIELLFVMVILAALAAIAIPSMSSGTESATLTSMRSDMQNTINLILSKRTSFDNFEQIIGSSPISGFSSNGFASITLTDNTQIPLSENNNISLRPIGAGIGNCTAAGQGFQISIHNPNIPNSHLLYSSCVTGKIIKVDN